VASRRNPPRAPSSTTVPARRLARLRTPIHPSQLAALGRRSRQVVLLAGAVGILTGLVVVGFEHLVSEVLLHELLRLPLGVQAVAPAAGLAAAWLLLRYAGRRGTPATADEYIRAYHDQGRGLDLAPVPGRLAAAIATLGAGGSLGFEGPAIYAGSAVGTAVQRRFRRYISPDDVKVLLVAGAAAGVAAIFKAPVTGLVFALEVPYQDDVARRALLPAAIASASSYVTFAALAGTEPLLPVAGRAPFDLVDIGGAALIGVVAGLLARVFVRLIGVAKRAAVLGHPALRIAGAGAALAACFVLGRLLAGQNLTLGPGYDALRWALNSERALWMVVALGTLRVVATTATVAGGGVGGLFIPLVLQGAFVGRAVGALFDEANATLFPVVGIAAFLGAGYRVPLASVVFVAEFTGRPGFVVPGLIAAVVSQLMMGRASISPYQVAGRVGHLERRLDMPLRSIIDTEARTAPPDTTVEELFWHHLVATRQRTVPVVDGSRYLGMVRADELAAVDRDAWPTTAIIDIVLPDIPVAAPDWHVRDAVRAMELVNADRIAVCDGDRFVGVVSTADIVRLDEILDRVEGGRSS
jgi:CIC family chloride channel protein